MVLDDSRGKTRPKKAAGQSDSYQYGHATVASMIKGLPGKRLLCASATHSHQPPCNRRGAWWGATSDADQTS